MKASLSEQSIVMATRNQVSCELGDETAILNLKKGIYYGLDPIGTHVWTLLQCRQSIGEIRDVITREYDIDRARCEGDLIELLQNLLDEGLIEVQDASSR